MINTYDAFFRADTAEGLCGGGGEIRTTAEMSAAAQQRMKLANEKAMKNVTHRGNVPKSTKVETEKYPVNNKLSNWK